jgi:hypothetical protein
MPTFTEKSDELDLELPALDGEDVHEPELTAETLDIAEDDGGDAFDDATGDDPAALEIAVEGAEGGWLVDAEGTGTLDVGPFDVVLEPEGMSRIADDDEADGAGGLEDLVATEETISADSGEEGPLADDEELREEDLPALDADEDGDVPDEDLYDRTMLGMDEDLRWEDRAWARVSEPGAEGDEPDDSGILAVPGDDPTHSARDTAWKGFEESGRVMAAAFVSGGSVVIALATGDRSRAFLVRIQPDGRARIIAEVDAPRFVILEGGRSATHLAEEDGQLCVVTFVRWNAARGCLFVGGNFGVEAYRPA